MIEDAIRQRLDAMMIPPRCGVDQKHIEEGTPERDYWHHGYAMALRDILVLIGQQKLMN